MSLAFKDRARGGSVMAGARKLESGWDDTATTAKKAFLFILLVGKENANERASKSHGQKNPRSAMFYTHLAIRPSPQKASRELGRRRRLEEEDLE